MKTKQLINQTLKKDDLQKIKLLTTVNIATKLLSIFKKHIGERNAISRGNLFKKVFGRMEEVSLADELRWDYVKRAMHLCRRQTKCFIGNKFDGGIFYFFVIKDDIDAQYYIEGLNKNIKAMRSAQRRAADSVRKKWYNLNWIEELEHKNKDLIEQR